MEYATSDAQAFSQPPRQYDNALPSTQDVANSDGLNETGNRSGIKVDEQGYSIPPANRSLIPEDIGEGTTNGDFFEDENQR
jgi:hypothetical protein